MKKHFLTITLCFALASTYGQERLSKIDTKDLTESQLLHIDQLATQDGWVLISHNGDQYVNNFSNSDYHLRMQLKCLNEHPPGFLIEYSDNYRDGDFGGLDFLAADDGDRVNFWIDGKNFKNAFSKHEAANFNVFIESLKKGKTLTVDVLGNRKIDFKLANPEYLDVAVECSPKKETEAYSNDEMEETTTVSE